MTTSDHNGSLISWEQFQAWRSIKPGMTLRHKKTGGLFHVDRRKDDDSGWWGRSGDGGLADRVFLIGDVWEVIQ